MCSSDAALNEPTTEMYEILSSELGDVRVEDFESVSLDDIERRVQSGRPVPRF